jgi:hypothetical protein
MRNRVPGQEQPPKFAGLEIVLHNLPRRPRMVAGDHHHPDAGILAGLARYGTHGVDQPNQFQKDESVLIFFDPSPPFPTERFRLTFPRHGWKFPAGRRRRLS